MNQFAAFEEQSLFSGAARVQGFSAESAPDLTTGLRERSEVEEANLRRIAAAENKKQTNDINRQVQIYDAIAQMGVPLAKQAAETLAKGYLDSQVIKAQNDYRKAKDFGTTPAGTEAYKALLERARTEGRITSEAADKLIKEGAPLEAINYIKGLPRYRQLFATQAYLQEKASTQKQRWEQFLATDTKTYTDVDGKTTFQAKDIGTNVYRGNIVYEAFALKDLTELGFSQEFNPNAEIVRSFNETVSENKDNYIAKLRNDKAIQDSEELVANGIAQFLGDRNINTLIRAYTNSYDAKTNRIRTRSEAIAAAMSALSGFYDAQQLTREDINNVVLGEVDWDPKKRSFSDLYKSYLYGEDGLASKLTAIDKRLLDAKRTQQQINLEKFKEVFQKEEAALRSVNKRFTNEDIKKIVEYGRNELQLSDDDMKFALQEYLTAEEQEDEAIRRKLQPRINTDGYVTEADLRGASPELYQEFAKANLIRSNKLEDISQKNMSEAVERIEANIGKNFLLQDGTVNTRDPEYVRQKQNAVRAYEQYMLEAQLASINQNAAQATVLQRLVKNIDAGTFKVKSYFPRPSTQAAIALSNSKRALLRSDFNYKTTLLPNSDPYLTQLDQWTRGEADFPDFYRQVTASNRNLSSWDLAEAQYRRKFGKNLVKTNSRRAFESQPAAVQRILNFHPTPARLRAAQPNTNFNASTYDQPFLDAEPILTVPGPINSANHDLFVAIGINEGTRRENGAYNPAWNGHIDAAKSGPAAGKTNRGTVSDRTPGLTPQQVDAKWIKILANKQREFSANITSFGVPTGTPGYNDLLFNLLDLYVQAPEAVTSFIKFIPKIVQEGVVPSVLGKYRAQSFYIPGTKTLNAPGFNNNYNLLLMDQRRRAGTYTLKRRGI